jgi:hypothetical protein
MHNTRLAQPKKPSVAKAILNRLRNPHPQEKP